MMPIRSLLVLIFLVLALQTLPAAIVSKTIDYTDEKGTALQGLLVYDNAVTGQRPGVLVIHDWRGLTDTTQRRCEMLPNSAMPPSPLTSMERE